MSQCLLCCFFGMSVMYGSSMWCSVFFFQAEDGIRDLVRSRGLGDVYKRQVLKLGFGVQRNGRSS